MLYPPALAPSGENAKAQDWSSLELPAANYASFFYITNSGWKCWPRACTFIRGESRRGAGGHYAADEHSIRVPEGVEAKEYRVLVGL